MINFRSALLYYYHHLIETESFSKKDIKDTADYLQTNLKDNTFNQLSELTDTSLGEVSGTKKVYPIDIIYTLTTFNANVTIHQQAQKSNLSVHEFVFLANAVHKVQEKIEEGEKN